MTPHDASKRIPLSVNPANPYAQVVLPDGSKPVQLGSGLISGVLGSGGMAHVYEIWNPQLEVHRAIKLLHPNYTDEELRRFETEIKMCAKLHHPNIVEIHSVGKWNDLPYIEMEKIDGLPLDRLIATLGALPAQVCTAVGIMIAESLLYAHNHEYSLYGTIHHGLIHRDLKPSNIMIAKDGIVKLMDFGIARPVDASVNTVEGSIIGTMQYLSPEQLDAKPLDVRSDIYSFGIILYEIVAGSNPFPDLNMGKLMVAKLNNTYEPLTSFSLKQPATLTKLINQCMQVKKEKRFSSAKLVLERLKKIHHKITALSPQEVLREFVNSDAAMNQVAKRKANKALIPVLAVAVILLVYGWVFYFVINKPSEFSLKITSLIPTVFAPKTESPKKAPVAESETPVISENTATIDSLLGMADNAPIVGDPIVETEKKVPVTPQLSSEIIPATPRTGNETGLFSLDVLKKRYATDDQLFIFCKEVESKKFASAAKIFELLPPGVAQSKKIVIYRSRLLSALGQSRTLDSLLTATDLYDGEFFLAKARMLYRKGSIAQSQSYLDKASTTDAEFEQSQNVYQDILFVQAQCRSILYFSAPEEKSYTAAIETWNKVAKFWESAPKTAYYKTAVAEIKKIENTPY